MKPMRPTLVLAASVVLAISLVAWQTPALASPSAASGPTLRFGYLSLPRIARQKLPSGQKFALHPDGTRLLDSQGQPFRIAAVNWYGAEEDDFVPGGLDQQPHTRILQEIRDLGYNTIRLPISDELVHDNPIITQGVDADPALRGQPALTVLGIIIDDAAALGLRIILDNHRSEAGWSAESNGLWYNAAAGYPESLWLDDWRIMAAFSLRWPNVIGVDLRNEPHTRGKAPWSLASYGSGATWGSGDPSYDPIDPLNTYCTLSSNCHDWHLAAERAADAVLAINPHLLIFVEGTQLSLTSGRIDENWWGGNLENAQAYPLQFVVDGQDVTAAHLVYSPHEYGPSVFHYPNYGATTTPQTLSALWQQFWGYLATPNLPQSAPVFLGEFGTCTGDPHCLSSLDPGSQGQWFAALISYLSAHPDISWAYWAINGTQSPAAGRQAGARESYGILSANWDGLANPALQADLTSITPTAGT